MDFSASNSATAIRTYTQNSRAASQCLELSPNNFNESAENVAKLIQEGQQGEAVALLNDVTAGQPSAIKDSLYRMTSSKLGASVMPEFLTLNQTRYASPVEVGNALRQINEAGSAPPTLPDTSGLTDQQKFMVYASIIEVRGNQAAKEALAAGETVILGLRSENNTIANSGKGLYDDRLAVLAKGDDGVVHVKEFTRVSTEPTAQYDGNQKDNVNLDHFRRQQGEDVTGDNIPELGRLSEGTTEMVKAAHANPTSAGGTKWALRPSADSVADGTNRVERDSNHDGKFDSADTDGVTDLNRTFKIHSGSRTNTDSAGCTTLHPDDYQDFQSAVTRDASQKSWQYVLTEVK